MTAVGPSSATSPDSRGMRDAARPPLLLAAARRVFRLAVAGAGVGAGAGDAGVDEGVALSACGGEAGGAPLSRPMPRARHAWLLAAKGGEGCVGPRNPTTTDAHNKTSGPQRESVMLCAAWHTLVLAVIRGITIS